MCDPRKLAGPGHGTGSSGSLSGESSHAGVGKNSAVRTGESLSDSFSIRGKAVGARHRIGHHPGLRQPCCRFPPPQPAVETFLKFQPTILSSRLLRSKRQQGCRSPGAARLELPPTTGACHRAALCVTAQHCVRRRFTRGPVVVALGSQTGFQVARRCRNNAGASQLNGLVKCSRRVGPAKRRPTGVLPVPVTAQGCHRAGVSPVPVTAQRNLSSMVGVARV